MLASQDLVRLELPEVVRAVVVLVVLVVLVPLAGSTSVHWHLSADQALAGWVSLANLGLAASVLTVSSSSAWSEELAN